MNNTGQHVIDILHAEAQKLREDKAELVMSLSFLNEKVGKLATQNGELLAALERLVEWADCDCNPSKKSLEIARAAIAKAKGAE